MSKKKKYEYRENRDRFEIAERRARKKALRVESKEKWSFNENEINPESEADDPYEYFYGEQWEED